MNAVRQRFALLGERWEAEIQRRDARRKVEARSPANLREELDDQRKERSPELMPKSLRLQAE